MTYKVIINLDYEQHSREKCRQMWTEIEQGMVRAGFRRDGRAFSINRPAHEATELARWAMEQINRTLDSEDSVYQYLRDFYGYNMACTTNLLLPASDTMEIELKR